MRVLDSLGQLRVAGKIYNEYSNVSKRPYPYKSEDELIESGIETDLIPPWGDMYGKDGSPAYSWPDYVKPPNVPSEETEVYGIRRGETSTLYPWAGTWNDNRISTRVLDRTTYPESPVMAGLGQGEKTSEGLGIIMVPIFGVVAYASYRAMVKEDKAVWKIALGAGAVIAGLGVLRSLAIIK